MTHDGKLVSEISEFPLEKVDEVFAEIDRQYIKVLLKRAKTKLEPLHSYLQKEIQALWENRPHRMLCIALSKGR